MIELVSIDLTNFRSYSSAQLVPLGMGQGMTAINGSNGTGKSSLVHGLLWALFGVTPDGVPVRALRRQGSDGEVKATVVIRHGGQTIEATRALRGRNDTTIAAISVDGVEQTNISAKSATAWMESRLGLDAEAFLTAFVVRQKELDSLVKARPADRRKTIERLAGIERMSSALDLARQDARQAQRLLEALPPAEDLAAAETRVEHSQAELAAAEAQSEAAEETATIARDAAENADSELRALRTTLQAARDSRADLELAASQRDNAAEAVERLEKLTEGAEDLAFAEAAAEDAREAREEAESIRQAADSVIAAAEIEARRHQDATQALQRAQNILAAAQDRAAAITSTSVDLSQLDSEITEMNALLEEVGQERGAARGEWDRLNKSIEELRIAVEHGAADCPTCAHPLQDPQALLTAQEQERAEVAEDGKALTARYSAVSERLAELQNQRAQAAVAAEQQANAARAVADAAQALKDAEAEQSRTATVAAQADERAAQARDDAERAAETIARLRQEETGLQAALRRAETAAKAVDELATARARLQAAQDKFAAAQTAHNALAQVSDQVDEQAAEARASETARAATLAGEAAAAARTARILAERDLTEALAAHARAVTSADSRKAALAEVERTTAVASTLEEFRRDRLARLAPELAEVASDFVSRMTDGRYTTVELDEDFTPILTDASGDQRPSSWLSGGEESAVALALRIAIGEVLAGQRGGLLILDEVLTAQDTQRRQATMGAIRALPRQVITINHVSEASDMVDLVAEVVDDGEGASTVVTYTPEHTVHADLSDALVDA